MVWNETFQKCNQILNKGSVIELKAKIEQDNRSDENRLTADDIIEITPDPNAVQISVDPRAQANGGNSTGSGRAANPVPGHVGSNGNGNGNGSSGHHDAPPFAIPVLLQLDSVRDTSSALDLIQEAAQQFPGDRPLHLEVRRANGQRITLEAGSSYRVSDEFTEVDSVVSWIRS
jgi:hypothetical protein